MTDYSIVVPTIGRPSLTRLLDSLRAADGPRPAEVVLVDDRANPTAALTPENLTHGPDDPLSGALRVVRGGGRGPAAARNAGWRTCRTAWIAFLDDDVTVSGSWPRDLAADLATAEPDVGGSQGQIVVPLPASRAPTDWERGTAGLATARWITADMAFRRDALVMVGGFDERFPRAFREDADLALRLLDAGWQLRQGSRATMHPVRPAPWHASVSQQRGNADDALMRRVHGPDWHTRAEAPVGRRAQHVVITALVVTAASAAALRHVRLAGSAAVGAAALVGEFAWARIAPGPRSLAEVSRMLATSAVIPPVATAHWLAGTVRHRKAAPWQGKAEQGKAG